MAAFNVTLDDSSPLITYSPAGAWFDSTNGTAPTSAYSASSYHLTKARAASASISFTGTGVWFAGARLPTYGAYQIAVDGKVVATGAPQTGVPLFNTTLGGVSGLANGAHTAVLTDLDGTGLDLDSVTFETQIGAAGATVSSEIVDDASSSIGYTPTGAWSTNTNANFKDNTLHFTDVGGAQATYSFSGEAFGIYGTTSPDHGNFSVAIDGQSATVAPFSGVSFLHSQNLLYFTTLSPGNHTVVLTANPGFSGTTSKFMDVDYYQVFSATSAPNNGVNAVPPSTSSNGAVSASTTDTVAATGTAAADQTGFDNDHHHHQQQFAAARQPNVGAIVGGVVGALLFLLLLVLGMFLYLRRRRRAEKHKSFAGVPATPALPWQFGPGASPVDTEKALPPPEVVVPTYAAPLPRMPAPGAVRFESHDRKDSSASVRTAESADDAPLLARAGPKAFALPRAPPASALKSTPSRAGQVARGAGPLRPSRPPSLQLTALDVPAPGVPQRPARPADPHLSVLHDRRAPVPMPAPMPAPATRPSRPSSPHLSEIDQPVPGRALPAGPKRPARPETLGIVDLYTR